MEEKTRSRMCKVLGMIYAGIGLVGESAAVYSYRTGMNLGYTLLIGGLALIPIGVSYAFFKMSREMTNTELSPTMPTKYEVR